MRLRVADLNNMHNLNFYLFIFVTNANGRINVRVSFIVLTQLHLFYHPGKQETASLRGFHPWNPLSGFAPSLSQGPEADPGHHYKFSRTLRMLVIRCTIASAKRDDFQSCS